MLCVWLLFLLCPVHGSRVKRIVGGEPAPAPPEDAPIIFTRFAGKNAQVEGVVDAPHYVFRGLRYGLAPTRKERFLRPRQYLLEGFENATRYPPPCVQPLPGQNRVVGSEDCLFLNVFTPTLPSGFEGLPVIVWIHGGGFRYGSASQYGVHHLVGKQVVVVTIQYRLGSLGFLSTGDKEMPGNAALWDMVLAVQWTRNYIGFFGGNPHRIAVMGHGTGASSALMVALSNVAKGLPISGVVAMSGSSVSRFAVDDAPKDTASRVADLNGCPTGSVLTMIRCLQSLSPVAIVRGDSSFEFERVQSNGFVSGLGGNRLGAAPVSEGRYDGRSLPPLVEVEPLAQLSEEEPIGVPLLTGITRDETKRACHKQYKDEILGKLKKIPNFLDKVLVTKLQQSLRLDRAAQLFKNQSAQLVRQLDPLHFGGYLKTQKDDYQQGLSKIVEATGDALFNVPAFLSAGAWAKRGAKAFLYRFEHVGRRWKGHAFLKGLPLVGNGTEETNSSEDTVGHGDELAYLFDAHDVEGRPLDQTLTPANADDERVRDIFTQMIVDFVRSGRLQLSGQEVRPFSNEENNYVQLDARPKVATHFRYCQMALWCGLTQRLQSATCKFLGAVDAQLKNVQNVLGNASNGVDLAPDSALSLLNPLQNASNGWQRGNVTPGRGSNGTNVNNYKNPLLGAIGQSGGGGGGGRTLLNPFGG